MVTSAERSVQRKTGADDEEASEDSGINTEVTVERMHNNS